MNTLALLVAMLAPAIIVAGALARTHVPPPAGQSSPPPGATRPAPLEENAVEGRIENVDPSRTQNGAKILTGLTVKD
jgi:hypothetical protein